MDRRYIQAWEMDPEILEDYNEIYILFYVTSLHLGFQMQKLQNAVFIDY